jgi:hypothetical protein
LALGAMATAAGYAIGLGFPQWYVSYMKIYYNKKLIIINK